MPSQPPPLIGRTREVDGLHEFLSAVPMRSFSLLEISGVAGIGKTTLLDEFERLAEERLLTCVRARAAHAESDFTFGVLAAVLDPILRKLEAIEELDEHYLADLAVVLPRFRGRKPQPVSPSRADLMSVARAAHWAVDTFASRHGGLCIIVDDQQWNDESSTFVLAYLARHPVSASLAIVTARRPGRSPLTQVIRAHQPTSNVKEIELGPMADDDALLLASGVEDEDRAQILRTAAGNPFFLRQLAQHRIDVRARPQNLPRDDTYPRDVTASILADVDRLSASARDLVRAACVIGDPFELSTVGEVAELADPELLAALDELVQCALVVPTPRQMIFGFRHLIIASVIYRSLTPGQQIATHARAAQVLLSRGAGALQVSQHIEASARFGDADAIVLLTAAGEQALGAAPATAARTFASALRLTPESGPLAEQRPGLMESRALCLMATGENDAARDQLTEALALIGPEDSGYRSRIAASIYRADSWLGQGVSPNPNAVADDSAEATGLERALFAAMRVHESIVSDDLGAARASGQLARAASDASELPWVKFLTASVVAQAELRIGSLERASDIADEAALLFEALSDDDFLYTQDSLLNLSFIETVLERWEEALFHARNGQRHADEADNASARMAFGIVIATVIASTGDLANAASVLSKATASSHTMGNTSLISLALATSANCSSLRGDFDDALALTEEAIAQMDSVRADAGHGQGDLDPMTDSTVALLLADILTEASQPARAASLLLEVAGGPNLLGLPKPVRARGYEILARAHIALGDDAAAAEWVERAQEGAAGTPLRLPRCYADRGSARLLLARRQYAEASVVALRAASSADASRAPLEAARAYLLAGEALAACDRQREAGDVVSEAKRIFDIAEATGWSSLAAKQLYRLRRSTHQHRRTTSGLESLTVREREIAELVAEGLTTREIAARLFVSGRTVENHLRKAFVKTGVTNRVELGSVVRTEKIKPSK